MQYCVCQITFHCLQVYKAHLTEGRQPSGPAVDSARQNLASTFVNAFVNAGFGQDKLMTVTPEGESSESVHWIFKNKVGLCLVPGCCQARRRKAQLLTCSALLLVKCPMGKHA